MENIKTNNGWIYTIENDTVTIRGRAGDELELTIPQSIEGFPVRHIGDSSFEHQKITTLGLPDGLISIGYKAFYDHHIRDLVIPQTVKLIKSDAFYHICSDLFQTVTIPADTELGRNAIGEEFMEYYNMYGKQSGTYIREGYWYKKNSGIIWDYYIENDRAVITGYHGNDTEVIIPSEIDGVSVSIIKGPGGGFGVFDYVKHEINTVIISDGITKIINSAFRGKSFDPQKGISKVIIPQSVTWIGENAFLDNKLTNITIPSCVIWIGEFAFSHNQLNEVNIPDGITEIAKRAFNGNKLTSIVIPNNVTSIGEYAFCNNPITDITIGSNVRMGNEAINREFTIEYEKNGKREGIYRLILQRWLFFPVKGTKTETNKNENAQTINENESHNRTFKDLNFGQAALATGLTAAALIAAPFIGGGLLIKAINEVSKTRIKSRHINKSKTWKQKPENEPVRIAPGTDHTAVIKDNHVEIFGMNFPFEKDSLGRPRYYISGELKTFGIKPVIIQYMGQKIPIRGWMLLHKNGSFHGSLVDGEYKLEHQGVEYTLSRGSQILFYPGGNLEKFTIRFTDEKNNLTVIETNFIVDGKKLILVGNDTVYLYESNGRPKTITTTFGPTTDRKWNWMDIDEDGNVTGRFIEKSQIPDYD